MSGVINRGVPKEWIPEKAREFAKIFKEDKEWWENYFFTQTESSANHLLKSLKLSKEQTQIMPQFVSVLLRDVYYHILRGLDGAVSIGGDQQAYKIYDENDNLISDCGDLEAAAWEVFYGDESED